MAEWWSALNLLQQIFLCAAIPFTVILIIQTILTFIGLAGHGDGDVSAVDSDADTDMGAGLDHMDGHIDGHADGHTDDVNAAVAGFRFFTLRGIVAFFCIFGWVGFVLGDSKLPVVLTMLISVASGLLAMLAIGLMFYATQRLQDSGNIRFSNAVGHAAQVYIPIPARREGRGKVMVMIQERLVEAEAITDGDVRLKTGETVEVVGSFGNTLIVK
jgi:membrane protein implicated in regulation of membrane protease activity